LELGSIIRIIGADEWNSMEAGAMSFGSAKEFDSYARDCVKLAEQPDAPPELREQLLQMAREWMKATMEAEEGKTPSDGGDPTWKTPSSPSQ
jgi:hypothetical protein